ncbi:MAG: phytoene desaturase family protein [Lactococcus lactis]|nr:phytoene desaturase family protein [Psychroflexus sp.]MDN6342470.1 phytoene desaturase family protein [Lactococcus lactis]
MPKEKPNVIVIGAGIAGLASALRLKKQGFEVDIYEQNNYTGGKIHVYSKNNYRFDLGPSLLTLPHLITDLFKLYNKNPEDYFTYNKRDESCRYFWEDGSHFIAPAQPAEFIDKAADFFKEDAKKISRYLENTQEKYRLTADLFLHSSLHQPKNFINKKALKAVRNISKLDLSKTLHQHNQSAFQNPKLIQFFDRYATYNGSSPYKTPGIMSMIPYLEMYKGTYLPDKGMHDISQSLTRLAQEVGIKIHLKQSVEEIVFEDEIAKGIEVNSELKLADVVISNMDVYTAYQSILKKAKKPKLSFKQQSSSSALIFYWGINKEFKDLNLHNILFSDNYKEEFNSIFNENTFHKDPTVYINITSKAISSDAPPGCENWFVMINAPTNDGQDWSAEIKEIRQKIISKINRILKVDLEQYIKLEHYLTPADIEKETSSHKGSLYGMASHGKFSSFLRHANFSSQIKNLYFCGGSVHPGGGIPLCLLSAKIVSDLIEEKHGLAFKN